MSKSFPDLSQPLFQDVPADLDETTWTSGVLTGGMAWREGKLPAEEFLLAANILVEQALRDAERASDLRNPILYLYRHALELFLKDAVKSAKRVHELPHLIAGLEARFGSALNPQVRDRLNEWVLHDPKSTAYRYSQAAPDAPPEERWVDLRYLREVMTFLAAQLRQLS